MMWMMLWFIVFWAAVIAGAVWLAQSWKRARSGSEALELLRVRLARGDIDTQEFEQRASALRQGERPSMRGPLTAVLAAVALVIAIPTVIVAANGWDVGMWDMHSRGQDTASDPVVRAGSAADVRIEDFSFQPGNLEVPIGAAVTWTNGDAAPHDATARNGDWNTERLSNGESDTLTFDNAGTFDYYCSIHPSMKARLVVR